MTAREQKLAEIAKYGKTMREWYREVYLYSAHWLQLRLRKLLHAGRKCQRCGIGGNLDIHHKNYRDIYDVEMDDLEALCRTCHQLEHHIKPTPKKPKPKKKPKGRKKKASKHAYKSSPVWRSFRRSIKREKRHLRKVLARGDLHKMNRISINQKIAELDREMAAMTNKIKKQYEKKATP